MISGVTPAWKDVHFISRCPPHCGAQYVRLDLDARMASEQLVSGAIMFDELHISRGTDCERTTVEQLTGFAPQGETRDRGLSRASLSEIAQTLLGVRLAQLVPVRAWQQRPRLFFILCAVTVVSSLLLSAGQTRGGFLSDTILELIAIPAFLASVSSIVALPRSRASSAPNGRCCCSPLPPCRRGATCSTPAMALDGIAEQ